MSTEKPHPQNVDVASINSIIQALYSSISFAAGGQPDYSRLRTLFHPDARITPPKSEKDNALLVLTVDEFLTRSREHVVTTGLERKGFIEKEIARRTETFGVIAQVFSTYESRNKTTDASPLQRGINSIQLVRDGHRWSILSILWDVERPGNLVPPGFLV